MQPEPYVWTWTEGGIRRQSKIHYTRCGHPVQWKPRFLGDPAPWFDTDHVKHDPAGYFADADLATLGMPVSVWSGFDTEVTDECL